MMEYLFDNWDDVEKKLNAKSISLFLDYDGTLTPIVDTPDKAVIPRETKDLLVQLSRDPRFKLAIISGRSLKDIKDKVGVEDIIYVGNHGLELEGPKIKHQPPLPLDYRAILDKIKDDLNHRLSSIKGTFVEDKGLSLSVHYRLVDEKKIPSVKDIFQETTAVYLAKKKIKIRPGKKVLEIRPPVEWEKGKIVLWLLARAKFGLKGKEILPIYLGDDVTDEDAFKALKGKGITIFVGRPKSSLASYYLKDTEEVQEFLNRLHHKNTK